MKLFINFILSSITALIIILILPGLGIDSYWLAAFVSLILGLINISIKPFLAMFSVIPTFFTIILALFLLNAAVIILADWVFERFYAENSLYVALFSAVLALINWGIHRLIWKSHINGENKNC